MRAIYDFKGGTLAQPIRLAEWDPCDVTAGSVYVIGFSSGRVKVGMTTDPVKRVASHSHQAWAMGHEVNRCWISEPHLTVRRSESYLLNYCRRTTETYGRSEYFESLDVEAVIARALQMSGDAIPTPLPSQSRAKGDIATFRVLPERFDAALGRIVTGGHATTLAEKATLLGLPKSSLGHMVNGHRPANAELVIALVRLGFTAADLDEVIHTSVVTGQPQRTGRRAAA